MPVMFSSKLTKVLSAKLLKPFISKDFKRTLSQDLGGKYSVIAEVRRLWFVLDSDVIGTTDVGV
jgi:hypothetical protein